MGKGVYAPTVGHMGEENNEHRITATYRRIPGRQAGMAAVGGEPELREKGKGWYGGGRPARPLQRASDPTRST